MQGGYEARLVHKSIEEDSAARQLAIKLGCKKLSDQDLFDCISKAKGHLKTAAKINLSIRELNEYMKWKNSADGNRWELWNVENLSADATAPIKISRCTEIPEDAIEESMMRVDVRRCVKKQI